MKTIGITGGNGLLGSKVIQAAEGLYQIFSIDLHEKPFLLPGNGAYISADICDGEHLFQKLDSLPLNGIIHTAAFTDVDGCESQKEKAFAVNVIGVENVVKYCADKQIKLVHLSTDYVFDGKSGPYSEKDEPNPISYYAKTKLEGERIVQKLMGNFAIARTTVLYGYMPCARPNFVTWLIDRLSNKRSVRIVSSQYGNPTLADDLASALMVLFEKDVTGIYNTTGRDWMNRFEFAQKIAEVFELDLKQIHPIKEKELHQPASRPAKGGLVCDKIQRDTGYQFLSVKDGLERMKMQMIENGVWPPL